MLENQINMKNIKKYDERQVEIISEKENYTEDDIKLLKWASGAHWYAKISRIDVVVDGEAKWNSKIVAQRKAEDFLKTL